MTQSMEQWKRSRPIWTPRPEQIRGMKLIVRGEGARLFLHPGKGKTSVVLKSFQILKKKGLVDKLLVLAPLRVVTTSWPSQIEYWEDFKDLTYTIVHGDIPAAMAKDVDVYLMNYEGLLSKHWQHVPTATRFLRSGKFMLAVDESTKMKNSSSKRFKTLKKYLDLTEYRTIMTGTPKPNKLEDLFSQCYITDLGCDLGQYVTHFRRQYMMPSFSGFGWDAQPGAMERVAEKIAPTTLQLEYEEAVPSQTVDIVLPLPPETIRHYNELKDEFLTVLGDEVVIAPTVAASLGKLRQFAQGALYFEEKMLPVHEVKLDALENLLAELDGEPLFCLTAFKSDVERIRARLGYTVPYIGSGTTAAQGAAWCASFGAGSIPLLLGHPSSVALGVDGLQNNCSNVCWFGQTWSWEEYYQANLRIIRSGSKADQVFIYRIMMDCGIEKAMRLSVEGKRDSEADFCTLLRTIL